jgi:hypothetical protein
VWFFQFTNSVHFGKYKNCLITDWVETVCPLSKPARASFKILTVAHLSVIRDRGSRPTQLAANSDSTLVSITDSGDLPRPSLSLSLSFPYKRRPWPEIFSPFAISSPSPRWAPLPTRRWLPDGWLGHLPIPLA